MKKGLIILFAFVLFISCKKTTNYWFTGMQIIDTSYNLQRWVGSSDNDWLMNKYTIPTTDLYAMAIDSSDTAQWNKTYSGNVVISPGINPIAYDSPTVYYQFNDIISKANCVFSYLITDQYDNVLVTNNLYLADGAYLPLQISIPTSKVQVGQVYRLYYACSAKGKPYFATGWGDFGVCSNNTLTNMANSCF